jgi:hypothetical protein
VIKLHTMCHFDLGFVRMDVRKVKDSSWKG